MRRDSAGIAQISRFFQQTSPTYQVVRNRQKTYHLTRPSAGLTRSQRAYAYRMGRPKSPVEQRRLHGRSPTTDAAGRPLPAAVTTLEALDQIPEPPEHLHASGRQHWARVWTQARAWVCQVDAGAVLRYCECFDMRDLMIRQIIAEGFTVTGSTGQPVAHPLLSRVEAVNAELRLLETQLGLTPSARAQLGVAEVKLRSQLDVMLERRRRGA
jgi:P27 family predicted phage terminase small subunit